MYRGRRRLTSITSLEGRKHVQVPPTGRQLQRVSLSLHFLFLSDTLQVYLLRTFNVQASGSMQGASAANARVPRGFAGQTVAGWTEQLNSDDSSEKRVGEPVPVRDLWHATAYLIHWRFGAG